MPCQKSSVARKAAALTQPHEKQNSSVFRPARVDTRIPRFVRTVEDASGAEKNARAKKAAAPTARGVVREPDAK
jgi:hypothetical protein